jgi:mRNA-degrading endonuclease RelE of RelBE toxin-antitoxin system
MKMYDLVYDHKVEKTVRKLKKKDPVLAEHLWKKLVEIHRNPEHFKPLRGSEFGKRQAHVGSFIVKFVVRGNEIKILEFEHHD